MWELAQAVVGLDRLRGIKDMEEIKPGDTVYYQGTPVTFIAGPYGGPYITIRTHTGDLKTIRIHPGDLKVVLPSDLTLPGGTFDPLTYAYTFGEQVLVRSYKGTEVRGVFVGRIAHMPEMGWVVFNDEKVTTQCHMQNVRPVKMPPSSPQVPEVEAERLRLQQQVQEATQGLALDLADEILLELVK